MDVRFHIAAVVTIVLFASCPNRAIADTIELAGHMTSIAKFDDKFCLEIPEGLRTLTVTIPIPLTTQSFGYSQTTSPVQITSSLNPESSITTTDTYGNSYKQFQFLNPPQGELTIDMSVDRTTVDVDLDTPLPHNPISAIKPPPNIATYLKATSRVQSTDPEIVAIARSFANDTDDEATISARIQRYLQQNVIYNSKNSNGPDDALSVLDHHLAVCDGWSDLFLAFARADGIPSRFVSGVNLGGDFTIPASTDGESTMTISSPCQSHSWVEVWFPSAGWVPFEPQVSVGFVDPHHVKIWAGADAAVQADFISWTSVKHKSVQIPISEIETAPKIVDSITVKCNNDVPDTSPVTVLSRKK